MKQTLNKFTFCEAFETETRHDQFSYAAREALFDYFEQCEEDTEIELEFDMIGICCEYTEYENFQALQKDYSGIETMDDLEYRTQVIMIDDIRFVIFNF